MFTGIIQGKGRIVSIENKGSDRQICIAPLGMNLVDVSLGDSIAVSGVCLTVTNLPEGEFIADVSGETLALTTVGQWRVGTKVNLEKALTLSSPLGGHLVSGHVDGLAELVELKADGRSMRMVFRVPDALAKYISTKGSICINGISLTVNAVDGAMVDVNIVPHTMEVTTLGELKVGGKVNLEVDLVARYLERLLLGENASVSKTAGFSQAFLARHGFAPNE